MTEQAIAELRQQFATVVETLNQRNTELQAEVARTAASSAQELQTLRASSAQELQALRTELQAAQAASSRAGAAGGSGAPASGSQSVGVDTRLLGKPGEFSGEQSAWRDWSAVFKGYEGAAVPRLQTAMRMAGESTEPAVNAALADESDRQASAQLYWMLLML